MADALPRSGLGAGQGARHALQHRRRARAWHSRSARAPSATGRAVTPAVGTGTRPSSAELDIGDQFEKHSYPLGILVNADGRRFVDEGADFHSFTYAKYGRAILEQPGQFAWQVFDATVLHLLRPSTASSASPKVQAQTLEELAGKLEDVNAEGFLRTDARLQQGRARRRALRPVHEGRPWHRRPRAREVELGQRDRSAPFEAYATTCGITFTFGGLRVDRDAQVLDHDAAKITGLYRRRRDGRRDLLLQLSERRWPRLGGRLRPPRRRFGGAWPGLNSVSGRQEQ